MHKSIVYNLPVSFLRESNQFIAYTPALDLSTSGPTLEEAKKNFTEAVGIFFDEIVEMGTFEDVLLDLGWKKQNEDFIPPVVISTRHGISEGTIRPLLINGASYSNIMEGV